MSKNPATTTEREVSIPCPYATLHGHLSVPSGAKGLVIFAHGSGSSRFSPRNRMVATKLYRRGIATLLIDLLTHAEAASDSMVTRRFDIPALSDRLIAATRWAQQQEEIRELGIGYFGASTGAAAALAAAALIPEIRAVVSRGGRTELADDVVHQVEAPTLLIVGEFDYPVIQCNEETLKRLDCVRQIRLIPGATHLFQEADALVQVADLAASWYERYLPTLETRPPADHECESWSPSI